jgi:hypothetical protein
MMKDQNFSSDHLEQNDLNGLPLDQIELHIGDPIQLQIDNKCHFATLIGYLKGQSFIVTLPDEQETPVRPDEGLPLVVRFFSDKRAYAFNTVVRRAASEPFPYLHLAYPEETQALKERQYDRVRVNIAGSADISNGKSLSCIVRDISIGGALIEIRDQTGVVNDPLLLTLRVVVNGTEYELSLDSEIRSIRVEDSSCDGDAPILHGLAFNDLSEHEILALAAFDLLPDWNGTI